MDFKTFFKKTYLKYGFVLTKAEMRTICKAYWRAAKGLK